MAPQFAALVSAVIVISGVSGWHAVAPNPTFVTRRRPTARSSASVSDAATASVGGDYAAVAAAARPQVLVCTNRWCKERGGSATLGALLALAGGAVDVRAAGCLGHCSRGPNLVVVGGRRAPRAAAGDVPSPASSPPSDDAPADVAAVAVAAMAAAADARRARSEELHHVDSVDKVRALLCATRDDVSIRIWCLKHDEVTVSRRLGQQGPRAAAPLARLARERARGALPRGQLRG